MRKFILPAIVVAGSCTMVFSLFSNRIPNIKNNTQQVQEKPLPPDTTIIIPQSASNFPALLVKRQPGDTTSVPLRLKELKMEIKVIGNLATNTMELTFYNDLDRILEGEFCFPLGEGQTVSGYGVDVEGEMRDGVVVEKAKGREVFESVVRKGIDPGLMEWTKGNNYKTRVYPIPAHGIKKVKISYTQELISGTDRFVYLQPMMFKEKIDVFSLKAEVLQQTVKPLQPENPGVNLQFKEWNQSWLAEVSKENYMPDKTLTFELPKTQYYNNVFLGDADDKGYNYFYATVDPEKFERPKKTPASICLLWDVSGSAANRDIKKELEIIGAYFEKIQETKIKLVTFSNEIHSEKEFLVSKGNWAALRALLESQHYDGGTQMGSIDLNKYTADEVILCSDGLSNFGESEMKLSAAPVITISSSPSADYSNLKYIALKTGGYFINALSINKEEAIKDLSTQPYHFIKATINTGDVMETYPTIPTAVHRTFSVSGMIKTPEAEVVLHFGFGNETVYTKTIKLNESKTLNSSTEQPGNKMIKRIWAEKKVNELDLQFEKNKEQITHLGMENNIVTRNTSLIVLDRLEDYIGNSIVPPTAKMKAQYFAALKANEESMAQTKKEHMEEVVTAFNERVKWWEKDFEYKKVGLKKSKETIVSDPMGVSYAVADSMSAGAYDMTVNENTLNMANNNTSNNNTANYSVATTAGATSENKAATFGWSGTVNTGGQEARKVEIDLKPWSPNEPYMLKLKESKKEELYATYLVLRDKYKEQPSFFLDAANYFMDQGEKKIGLRVLSNLAEMTNEDHRSLRVMAHRLRQKGFNDLAICTFKEVLKLREEEPQSYRDLGLALADNKQFQDAIDVMCKVVNKNWDGRFPEIEVLVANEINNIITSANTKLDLSSFDKRLQKPMPVDVRIVINWDSDNCDMDLWVTDPEMETCLYSNPLTQNGGKITRDFTGGYGPEEFVVKKALNGKYKIRVNYFGNHDQSLYGPTTVTAELYTNYGKPNQIKKNIILRLKENKEVVDIGQLVFGN